MDAFFPYLWLIVIIAAAILEGATSQMVSIWMVVGGIAALIASVSGAGFLVQLVLFVAVTVLTLAVTRPFVKKMMRFKKSETNADRYVGKQGMVVVDIDNTIGQGQVKVLGSVWTARSADDSPIPVRSFVTVTRIDGVKLIVEPVKQN